MAELVTVDHLVAGYARAGERAAEVGTIHDETVATVAADRAAAVPPPVPSNPEE